MATIARIDLKQALGPTPKTKSRRLLMRAAGYEPHAEQEAFHFGKNFDGTPLRFKLVAGGEQAGKSFSAAMEMLSFLPWGHLYWIVGPDYDQTKTEFKYLEEKLRELGALKSSNTPERSAWKLTTIWGAEVVTKSAKNPETIAGRAPDGILLVEAAQAPYDAFLRCLGRTAPKKAWLCVNGTFEKDSGAWYRATWKKWQASNKQEGRSFSLPSWTNKTFYPGGKTDPEIQRLRESMSEDFFNERYAGLPVPPQGLVHRAFSFDKHVKLVDRQPGIPPDLLPNSESIVLPIETEDELWVDPGWANGYSVLFVTWWRDVAVVYDEIYVTLRTHEEVANLAMQHPRWQYVERIVMDIAGKQHAASKSAFEVWKEVTGISPVGRKVGITDGISRVNLSLHQHPITDLPGLLIGTKCVKTHWELSDGYRYRTSTTAAIDATGEATYEVIDGLPVDKNNHSAKALAYGLTYRLGLAKREKKKAQALRRQGPGEAFD